METIDNGYNPLMHWAERSFERFSKAKNSDCPPLQNHCSSKPTTSMIRWNYFPRSTQVTARAVSVVAAFEAVVDAIDSSAHALNSNAVLALAAPHLIAAGFDVEAGKRAEHKIKVPVLFGQNGRLEKSFDADAYHRQDGFVVEVEAGRGFVNNQFLKDLFQACMMHDVYYLAIAVRNTYMGHQDFDGVSKFFDTLYASRRLQLPLNGILVIGY